MSFIDSLKAMFSAKSKTATPAADACCDHDQAGSDAHKEECCADGSGACCKPGAEGKTCSTEG
ncbi:MAG: hypothetical protein WAZ14_03940 [Patescibacteria group bacterium]